MQEDLHVTHHGQFSNLVTLCLKTKNKTEKKAGDTAKCDSLVFDAQY